MKTAGLVERNCPVNRLGHDRKDGGADGAADVVVRQDAASGRRGQREIERRVGTGRALLMKLDGDGVIAGDEEIADRRVRHARVEGNVIFPGFGLQRGSCGGRSCDRTGGHPVAEHFGAVDVDHDAVVRKQVKREGGIRIEKLLRDGDIPAQQIRRDCIGLAARFVRSFPAHVVTIGMSGGPIEPAPSTARPLDQEPIAGVLSAMLKCREFHTSATPGVASASAKLSVGYASVGVPVWPLVIWSKYDQFEPGAARLTGAIPLTNGVSSVTWNGPPTSGSSFAVTANSWRASSGSKSKPRRRAACSCCGLRFDFVKARKWREVLWAIRIHRGVKE